MSTNPSSVAVAGISKQVTKTRISKGSSASNINSYKFLKKFSSASGCFGSFFNNPVIAQKVILLFTFIDYILAFGAALLWAIAPHYSEFNTKSLSTSFEWSFMGLCLISIVHAAFSSILEMYRKYFKIKRNPNLRLGQCAFAVVGEFLSKPLHFMAATLLLIIIFYIVGWVYSVRMENDEENTKKRVLAVVSTKVYNLFSLLFVLEIEWIAFAMNFHIKLAQGDAERAARSSDGEDDDIESPQSYGNKTNDAEDDNQRANTSLVDADA